MREERVHIGGMLTAAGMVLVATVGYRICEVIENARLNPVWATMYLGAVVLLSGAVVDFDPKRWLV